MKRFITKTIISLLVLGCGLVFAPPSRRAVAHKFHTSFTRIEYNRERQTAEISIRTFADDIEVILTKRTGKAVYLDTTKDVGALVFGYVRDSLALTARDDTQPGQLKWIGMETNVDSVWIYLEAPMPGGFAGAGVRQRLLFDLFQDQVNIVNIIDGERKADLVFKRDDSTHKMFWASDKK